MNIFIAILLCFGFLLVLMRGLGFGLQGAPAALPRYYHFGWLGVACFALVAIIKFWPA